MKTIAILLIVLTVLSLAVSPAFASRQDVIVQTVSNTTKSSGPISNIMKTEHDTARKTIQGVR